jgi:dTDP-4-amino-4,6-dideoxygalactose transaminase
MGMPFIDLGEQYRRIERDVRERIDSVLAHGKYIMGPEVAELEAELADFCGARHAISCASGTDALLLPLMAWGIGPGDAVFVPPFTFFATAEVVSLLGATPVFVDVDPVTYCMDPDRLEAAILAVEKNDASIHPLPRLDDGCRLKPRVIIPVDLFGIPAQYEKIFHWLSVTD